MIKKLDKEINKYLDLTWSAFSSVPIWVEPKFAEKKFFFERAIMR